MCSICLKFKTSIKITKICPICRNSFLCTERLQKIFCSRGCANRSAEKIESANTKNRHKKSWAWELVNCKKCGVSFQTYKKA